MGGCRIIYDFQAGLGYIMEPCHDEREEGGVREKRMRKEVEKKKKTVGKKLNMGSGEEVGKKRKEGQMEREGRGRGGREGGGVGMKRDSGDLMKPLGPLASFVTNFLLLC